jgi:hypothetical protein
MTPWKTTRSGGMMCLIKIFVLLSVIAVSIFYPAAVFGDDIHGIYEFAKHLHEEGEYYRAITEYKRFQFLNPDHKLADECTFRICRSYLEGNRLNEAVQALSIFLHSDLPKEWVNPCYYSLGEAYYYLHDYKHAIQHLNLIPENSLDLSGKKCLEYSLFWCHLNQKNWSSTEGCLSALITQIDHEHPWQDLSSELIKLQSVPQKKPLTAGLLSALIPGAGQGYCNRWDDAVLAFLLNAVFIGGISYALHEDHNETAAVLGFFELGWYSANIYNAVNAAHKANRSEWERHLDYIEKRYGSPFESIY